MYKIFIASAYFQHYGKRISSITQLCCLLLCLSILPVSIGTADDDPPPVDPRVERIRKDLGYYKEDDQKTIADLKNEINGLKTELRQTRVEMEGRLQRLESALKINTDKDAVLSDLRPKSAVVETVDSHAVETPKAVTADSGCTVSDPSFITCIKIEMPSAEGSNNPITFAQLFVEGEVVNGYQVKALGNDGREIPIQVDVKVRHHDGSIKHAVISAIISNSINTIRLYKYALKKGGAAPTVFGVSSDSGKPGNFNSNIAINIAGKIYTAALDRSALRCDGLLSAMQLNYCRLLAPASQKKTDISPKVIEWLSGAIVQEMGIPVNFIDEQGAAHPHLMARFFLRKYADSNNARLDITIENNWTYKPNPQNIHYSVEIYIQGEKVFAQQDLIHYQHARWRKIFWTGKQKDIHLKHDVNYLIKTKAIPNYDTSLVIDERLLEKRYGEHVSYTAVPMTIGMASAVMGTTGAHEDIGPLPNWAVHYLLTMDRRAKNVTLVTGDMAGTWGIHFRDHNTDLPVSLVDYPYLSTHWNRKDVGPHPIPWCETDCKTPYEPDEAHQPSLAFLPYLVTGDYYYLEELQFWTNWNAMGTEPVYRMLDQGLVKWQQLRGMAWSLRNLGQTAYITPDDHPLKSYFNKQINYNLDYFNKQYTNNPDANKLGIIIDGYSLFDNGLNTAPWQQDFFTWSVGYLADLGFSQAKPLLLWNSKFIVNRLANKDFCWISATNYAMRIRNSSNDAIFSSFKDVYKYTVPVKVRTCGALTSEALTAMAESLRSEAEGKLAANCQCNSREMVANYEGIKKIGEMIGYSDSPAGYPANLQPALAIINDYKAPLAKESWAVFNGRTVKPDYVPFPVWSIIPRH